MTRAFRHEPDAALAERLAEHALADLARSVGAAAIRPPRPRQPRGAEPEKSSSCKRAGATAGRIGERSAWAGAAPDQGPRDLRRGLMRGFPHCRRILGLRRWDVVVRGYAKLLRGADRADPGLAGLPAFVAEHAGALDLPPFAADLVRLEHALCARGDAGGALPVSTDALVVNPSLAILELDWRLIDCVTAGGSVEQPPAPGRELAMVWQMPLTGAPVAARARDRDLLVIKMALEGISEEQAARAGGVSVRAIADAVDRVVRSGVVLGPRPGLRRSPACFPIPEDAPDEMVTTRHFTLQWHITNACDLRCRHCYDRSRVETLQLEEMQRIVDDFASFCRRKRIWGDFCLTGGNPLLYPRFLDLYRAIAATELSVSFLGNPTSRQRLEEIVAILEPRHFQVSLEGLEEHTDRIRGRGHFARVMEFLPLLRELGISSGVMLTLARDNLEQVIPLADALEGVADSLTFNRLAQVGEGASLEIPTRDEYAAFLARYQEAARTRSVLAYKDNLFNALRHQTGEPYTDGCTGFGCGAAFNFIAVLPNGDAHACRKFPSPIGSVLRSGIEAVLESDAARRYRAGSAACRDCAVRLYCGGCMAVVHGAGLDPCADRDPHCFLEPT